MAYATLVSLEQTIHRLLNSSDHVSILPSSRSILDLVYEEAQFLQKLLKILHGSSNSSFTDEGNGLLEFFQDSIESHAASRQVLSRLESFSCRSYRCRGQQTNALDGKIREAACKLEDALEKHVVENLIHHDPSTIFSMDLQELKEDINSFTLTVKELLTEECINELFINPLPDEKDDGEDGVPSRDGFRGKKSKMVGFSDVFSRTRLYLVPRDGPESTIEMVSLVGMAGIGKTTLAEEAFEDPSILSRFDHRAWITVGPEYQLKDILQCILSQVSPDTDGVLKQEDDKSLLAQHFYESLEFGRHLIVLDDVWDQEILRHLLGSFPYGCDGIRDNYRIVILLTTRLEEVGSWASGRMLKLRFLNKEESWDLLRQKVFDEMSDCPPQLEKSGKKIAENCDGLPLAIVTVADLLSEAEKTLEYWNKVAKKENSVFMDAYDRMSKVLSPSYEYLPQYLKACFLYMAVFPQNYEIPVSKLSMLWIAEGFLEPNLLRFANDFSVEYLEELVGKSFLLTRQRSHKNKFKTCGLHSVFWHLCRKEAGRNKFLHVLNSYANSVAEGIKSQRRLCVHKNVLFGIKGVRKSMASISTARSLLCTGQHHRYPVQVCFGHLRLLRVIDALTIRFYEFPMEVLKLVQLRYLSLTSNGKIPSSISKLWNLQFLVVLQHLSIIKLNEDESYLPMEIWNMKELKHLHIMGSDLPDPHDGALLPNLETLLDVIAHGCTKNVLERIPNLIKLGIRIESAPDVTEPFSCFDHISHLKELRSLKCVVVNPELRSKVVAPPTSSSLFPARLKKLSLSGFGYPWEHMKIIAALPNLRVLKLRCYAFRGPKWETRDKEFRLLEFLHIEDTDLEHWIVRYGSFSWLKRLSLRHCYRLKAIPFVFRNYLSEIEVVDCNPLCKGKEEE